LGTIFALSNCRHFFDNEKAGRFGKDSSIGCSSDRGDATVTKYVITKEIHVYRVAFPCTKVKFATQVYFIREELGETAHFNIYCKVTLIAFLSMPYLLSIITQCWKNGNTVQEHANFQIANFVVEILNPLPTSSII